METEVIGEIATGESSTVKVSTFVGKDGKKRVDIRLFITATKKENGYIGPTKKGCTLPVEKVPELVKILGDMK